jgi:hypothetical protein
MLGAVGDQARRAGRRRRDGGCLGQARQRALGSRRAPSKLGVVAAASALPSLATVCFR